MASADAAGGADAAGTADAADTADTADTAGDAVLRQEAVAAGAGERDGERDGGGPGDGGRRAGPGWLRVRLRAAPVPAVAAFLLVLVTAFLAAALPRAVDRTEDHALRQSLTSSRPKDRGISLADSYDPGPFGSGQPVLTDRVDSVEAAFQKWVRPPLYLAPGQAVVGVRTATEATAADPWLARTSEHDPAADLVAQAGLGANVRLVTGRLPGPVTSKQAPLEGVVTEQTARVLHLTVGRTVHLTKASPVPLEVRITGIVAPRDPKAPWWIQDDDLLHPLLTAPLTPPGAEPKTYWHFTVLTDRSAADSFTALGQGASLYWYHPLDVPRTTAHDVSALQHDLTALDSGPESVALERQTGSAPHLAGALDSVLSDFTEDRKASRPLVLIASVGVGAAALAVLLMAGGLAADRRRAEIVLLRSRGGSLRRITGLLSLENAAAVVPAGVLGVVLALATLPTARLVAPVCLGAAAAACALLAMPLRAAWTVRRPRPGGREDLAAARPSRRRLVTELTVTVLVVGAVVALRQRRADGDDPFLAAAPVLVAVGAALVLLRVYPLPLRLLARPAARLSGAVTHLGLARAGRAPATAQLPLLALLVSLSVASFGGSVLAGVDHGRDRAASATVGADARIDARFALSRQLPGEVRKVPGVGQLLTARVEPNSPNPSFSISYSVVIIDPDAYERLTRAAGLPAFPASVFHHWDGHGPLPAVVSPKLASELGGNDGHIDTGVGGSDVHPAATLSTTAAVPGSDFVIVSAAQLDQEHPDTAAFTQNTEPNTMLLMNAPGHPIDGPALHKAASGSTSFVTVLLRGEQRAAMTDSPLQHGARRIYLAAVLAGAGYSVLALLLSLLQAAPQRTALLARLRTMGMTRGQARRLVLLEMLPQVLLAAVGGVLVGLAVVPLLGPGVDLKALTFGRSAQDLPPVAFGLGLRADPWSLALPSAGLLVVACAVLLAQAWWSGRRRESTELRVGDRA